MSGSKKKGIRQYCCDSDKSRKENYDELILSYIDYYHKRAMKCKWSFLILNLIKIILIGALPVLQLTEFISEFPWSIAVLSAGTLVIESVLELWRMKEKWILYRGTCNRLMAVQRQYAGRDESKEQEYISAMESIIDGEGNKWLETVQDKAEKKDAGGN